MGYDVAIIGGGVIGCAIARELSRLRLNIVVLEKECDVAAGSSKANSGIVHGGHDCTPGTLKARFNVEANPMFDELSKTLDFPFKRNGSLVLAFEEDQIPKLEALKQQGIANGVPGLEIIGRDEIVKLEPNISDTVVAALQVPTGGIVCPYEMTFAFAENAAANGVTFRLNFFAETIEKRDGLFYISGPAGEVTARVLINAAGLYADTVNNMLSKHPITITPRSGEYCLLDKTEGDLVSHTLFQLPTKAGKGILVTPTVDGNLLLGPTSHPIADKDDKATTRAGLQEVLQTAQKDVQHLPVNKVITSFTGLRATAEGDDFIIGPSPDVENLFNVAGIASPGLTSAPAIAQYVAGLVAQATHAEQNPDFQPVRRAFPRFRHMTDAQRQKAIAENPDYGHIICRCEQVTKAEILAAIRGPLGVHDIDAIKRRTRAGMGRCQGGFCLMRIPEIVAQELHIPLNEVTKNGSGTNLLMDPDKQSL
ncbi:MAG TPA: NAD(P)/FAD-dependent oxidoreductase [Candidatus Limiplasma sp.]|nr:NAD(P)/FAD-dependent oxidoreductase [Candidatus Limiplasma sp.]